MDVVKNIQRTHEVSPPLVQSVLGTLVATGTPLIYTYINPYGRFEVDFGRRINFERKAA